ncbi:hypothetical protein DFA_08831 [Cavenderia fasciculata]|uniref:Uncharacterized protein n=1 Tax=Cavenderia fasciculata TaxID=261658 RepID=F4Q4I1_CACFS|nr:uncharacterized protein DFA_08831 [Cavenderia fasciculata]EGG17830.1 hypothetical protein DFA_08831 [Cavenderia fasciculata]|eukprot:XP_004356314.1 hypothetical protein DFA_08831 [Cavenderia fasciculata]
MLSSVDVLMATSTSFLESAMFVILLLDEAASLVALSYLAFIPAISVSRDSVTSLFGITTPARTYMAIVAKHGCTTPESIVVNSWRPQCRWQTWSQREHMVLWYETSTNTFLVVAVFFI